MFSEPSPTVADTRSLRAGLDGQSHARSLRPKPGIHSTTAVLMLLASLAESVYADRWRPLPQGGGCWVDDRTGNLWGCTTPPAPTPPAPAPSPAIKRELENTKAQLQDARRENEDLSRVVDAYEQAAAAEAAAIAAEEERVARVERARRARAVEAELQERRVVGRQEAAILRMQDERLKSCADQLAEMGYTHVRDKICKAKGGAFVDCPPCPGR